MVNSGKSHFTLDPAHLGWLRTSLNLYNKAMELYLDDSERTRACMPSDGGGLERALNNVLWFTADLDMHSIKPRSWTWKTANACVSACIPSDGGGLGRALYDSSFFLGMYLVPKGATQQSCCTVLKHCAHV